MTNQNNSSGNRAGNPSGQQKDQKDLSGQQGSPHKQQAGSRDQDSKSSQNPQR